jgi:hypothetical protein
MLKENEEDVIFLLTENLYSPYKNLTKMGYDNDLFILEEHE